jgi:hypothetical protein
MVHGIAHGGGGNGNYWKLVSQSVSQFLLLLLEHKASVKRSHRILSTVILLTSLHAFILDDPSPRLSTMAVPEAIGDSSPVPTSLWMQWVSLGYYKSSAILSSLSGLQFTVLLYLSI